MRFARWDDPQVHERNDMLSWCGNTTEWLGSHAFLPPPQIRREANQVWRSRRPMRARPRTSANCTPKTVTHALKLLSNLRKQTSSDCMQFRRLVLLLATNKPERRLSTSTSRASGGSRTQTYYDTYPDRSYITCFRVPHNAVITSYVQTVRGYHQQKI